MKGFNPNAMSKEECGRLGGQSKSPAKQRAVRENGKLGGRPRTYRRSMQAAPVKQPSTMPVETLAEALRSSVDYQDDD